MPVRLLVIVVLLFFQSPGAARPAHPTQTLGFRLLKEMKQDENAVVSPLSLHLAFAMTAAGAEGATQTEMLQALGLGQDFLKTAQDDLAALAQDGAEVAIANRLWPAKSITLKQGFTETCSRVFAAQPQPLNFRDTEAARKSINDWVSGITHQHIPELLKPGQVDPGTRLALTNALYFKGGWLFPFEPQQTKPLPFQGPSGQVMAMMMHHTKPHTYLQTAEFHLVRLDYNGSDLSMTLLVPKRVDGWKTLRKNFDPAILQQLDQEAQQERPLELTMPRFKLRANLEVVPAMQKLGMTLPFTAGADFSKMTNESGISISEAVHEAMVEVDEVGTVGAAATAVMLSRSGSMGQQLVIDRPFLFLISDSEGRTLFIGQVLHPELAPSR